MSNSLKMLLILAALCLLCVPAPAAAQDIKIGVLAKNGAFDAATKWETTADYLSAETGNKVTIVPLDFKAVYNALEIGSIDFLLANPTMFVTARNKYGVSAVVTMINFRKGKALSSFGGVIFTKADNTGVNTLADTRGKTVSAVRRDSFGGLQVALKEYLDAGIDPNTAFAGISFAGNHNAVVEAVLKGDAEIGFVRTDTLERLAAKNLISMDDFKIINQKQYGGFPFVCSTRLYPEWPLAKASATSYETALEIGTALKKLKPSDAASLAAIISGWTDPLDYGGVEDVRRELGVEEAP